MTAAIEKNTYNEEEECNINEQLNRVPEDMAPKKEATDTTQKIIWVKVAFFLTIHLAGLYGLYMICTAQVSWKTCLWGYLYLVLTAQGGTSGAHRLWSHKAYKARMPLKIMLMIFNSALFQQDVIRWCRDHRVHHKYSDTIADPSDASRGFWYSHVGWLCLTKHPEVLKKGKQIDLSDLYSEPVLTFQKRHYMKLVFLFWFLLPTLVPMYYWAESFSASFFVATMVRYCWTLNGIWLINSWAHIWGSKPFNTKIRPADTITAGFCSGFIGEAWHNYHHTFPWDYRASELSWTLNISCAFIDICAFFNLAYDLRKPSDEQIDRYKMKYGDGSRSHKHCHAE